MYFVYLYTRLGSVEMRSHFSLPALGGGVTCWRVEIGERKFRFGSKWSVSNGALGSRPGFDMANKGRGCSAAK